MREMKGKCLAGLVLAFLLAPLVRADGLDHFVWERTDGPPFNTYTWDWASSGPASEFTALPSLPFVSYRLRSRHQSPAW
jgi:hypothetical protein